MANTKNQVQFVADLANKSNDGKYSVLLTSTHHFTDTAICKTGHNFYNLDIPQFPIKWPTGLGVPDNMKIIKSIDELPYKPDIIISQNIVDQYNIFAQLAGFFDCPIISFEHTLPTDEWIKMGQVDMVAKTLEKVPRVFITEYSKNAWKGANNSNVIYHMVDLDKFDGSWTFGGDKAMILVNAFKTRTWAVGDPTEYMQNDERIDLFGSNPGYMSRALNHTEIPQVMKLYGAFINTSLRSPIPASILEAAAMGMPILSTKTCAIPEFFEHEKSILFFNSPEECKKQLDKVLSDKDFAETLGQNAREVILRNFNQMRYVRDWNNLLEKTIGDF